MISSMVIVFREMLEMVLVVGVLLAATRGLTGSRFWIGLGVFGGLLGAVFLAVFMERMEASFDGDGEFIFNAVVLLLASTLIAWTVLWMSKHGRMMAQHMKQIGGRLKKAICPIRHWLLLRCPPSCAKARKQHSFYSVQHKGSVMMAGVCFLVV